MACAQPTACERAAVDMPDAIIDVFKAHICADADG